MIMTFLKNPLLIYWFITSVSTIRNWIKKNHFSSHTLISFDTDFNCDQFRITNERYLDRADANTDYRYIQQCAICILWYFWTPAKLVTFPFIIRYLLFYGNKIKIAKLDDPTRNIGIYVLLLLVSSVIYTPDPHAYLL